MNRLLRDRDTRDGRLRKHRLFILVLILVLILILLPGANGLHRGVSDPDRSCTQHLGKDLHPDKGSDQDRSCSLLRDRCQDRDRDSSCLQDRGSSCRLVLGRLYHRNGRAVRARWGVGGPQGLINSQRLGMGGPLSRDSSRGKAMALVVVLTVVVVRLIRRMRMYRIGRLRILRSRVD